ncbi:hypothetical protein MRX96_002936 [Rhipicephalus microplus]
MPRNIADCVAIEVCLITKRHLITKLAYKRGLLKKFYVKVWLPYLINLDFDRHHKKWDDPSTLDTFPKDEPPNKYEIEITVEIRDANPPVKHTSAIHSVSHTVVLDGAALDSTHLIGGTHYLATSS